MLKYPARPVEQVTVQIFESIGWRERLSFLSLNKYPSLDCCCLNC